MTEAIDLSLLMEGAAADMQFEWQIQKNIKGIKINYMPKKNYCLRDGRASELGIKYFFL